MNKFLHHWMFLCLAFIATKTSRYHIDLQNIFTTKEKDLTQNHRVNRCKSGSPTLWCYYPMALRIPEWVSNMTREEFIKWKYRKTVINPSHLHAFFLNDVLLWLLLAPHITIHIHICMLYIILHTMLKRIYHFVYIVFWCTCRQSVLVSNLVFVSDWGVI